MMNEKKTDSWAAIDAQVSKKGPSGLTFAEKWVTIPALGAAFYFSGGDGPMVSGFGATASLLIAAANFNIGGHTAGYRVAKAARLKYETMKEPLKNALRNFGKNVKKNLNEAKKRADSRRSENNGKVLPNTSKDILPMMMKMMRNRSKTN